VRGCRWVRVSVMVRVRNEIKGGGVKKVYGRVGLGLVLGFGLGIE